MCMEMGRETCQTTLTILTATPRLCTQDNFVEVNTGVLNSAPFRAGMVEESDGLSPSQLYWRS